MLYLSSCGRIEIKMNIVQARSCTHPGPCDDDVKMLSLSKSIRPQLEKINAAVLREELAQYGAWDDEELADHYQNLQRILWIAAGSIVERHV